MHKLAHGKAEEPRGQQGSKGASGSNASMPEQQPSTSSSASGPNPPVPGQSKYEELCLIGNGAFGTVYKARDNATNNIVALKKIRVPLTDDGIPMYIVREISVLRRLDVYEHPNIVRLLDVVQGQRIEREKLLLLYLVFEHIDQDLAKYLEKCPSPGLPPNRIKDIMFQVLSGVDFLHANGIIHRDLKPQNILVTNSGAVKIADFGLAKLYDFEMKLTSVVVTLWYRSPEVLLGQTYATPVDIWSCGCIMGELHKLQPLFPGSSEGDQLDRIFRVIGTPSESEWPENVPLMWSTFPERVPVDLQKVIPDLCPDGKDLLEKMLRYDHSQRISSSAALRHPYFRSDGFVPIEMPTSSTIPFGALL